MLLTILGVIFMQDPQPFEGSRPLKPAKVVLQLEQLSKTKQSVTLRVIIANEGEAIALVDPAILTIGTTEVWFRDESGKHVSYEGESLRGYAMHAPEKAFPLGGGEFFGYRKEFKFNRAYSALTAHARASYAYPDKTDVKIWTGRLDAKPLRIR